MAVDHYGGGSSWRWITMAVNRPSDGSAGWLICLAVNMHGGGLLRGGSY